MPQISLYIDEKTLQKVESAAKRQHLSISKWVAEQIRAKVDPIYPVDFEGLFGSIQDDTFVVPSKLNFNQDAERLQF
jgi:hypothetical protein